MTHPSTPKRSDPRTQPPSGQLLCLIQDQCNELISAVRTLGAGLASEVELSIRFRNRSGLHHLKELLSATTIRSRGIKTRKPDQRILESVQRQCIAFVDCLMEFGDSKIESIELVVRYVNGTAFTYDLIGTEPLAMANGDDEAQE